jgi:YVTN family beta-propeller protein
VVRSSGGAQTANEHGRGRGHGHDTADTPQAEPEPAPAEDAAVATTPTEEQGVVASPEVTAATTAATTTTTEAEIAALDDAVKLASDPTSVGTKARQPKHLVLSEISEIPPLTASLRADSAAGIAEVAHGGIQIAVLGLETSTMAADVNTTAVRRDSTAPGEDASTRESLPIFTGVLAAALAPFVMPFPGSPVNQPTLWALLAWTRRQFERETTDGRPALVAYPRHTESVLTDPNADPPGAIVDRIDRVTGRVTGRVNVIDVTADERAGLTYALVEQVDRRLGVVAVNGTTGQWTFTPNQTARLAAQLSQDGGIATFSVAASNGRTVDVRAPVDPAEAVVTGTINVGDGLTYGLAAVGDRLYVLNGSNAAAGNGSVKIIDTSTGMVIGSVEVGSMPFALAASGQSLYVGNADDGTVSVVDVTSHRVVDVIDVGANPFGLEVTGDRLYVADLAGTVSVIDLTDNTELARIPVGGDPFGVAATADRVYVTNYAGGAVAVVDKATNTAHPGDVAGYPYFAAVVGRRLYVVNSATNALTIVDGSVTTAVDVDATTRAVDAIPNDAAPVDVVVRGDRLYVSNINCGSVTVVDVATNQPVESIAVGIQPGLMTASPDGRTIYVADVMGGAVQVITSVRHAAR